MTSMYFVLLMLKYTVCGMQVFVPDEDGILATATSLQYNDAPWLQRGQHAVPVRLVHPKISASVGDCVGAVSLRLKIAEAHAHDALDFDFNEDGQGGGGSGGDEGVKSEAFGQSESITRRLRHILELYPEGMFTHNFTHNFCLKTFCNLDLSQSIIISLRACSVSIFFLLN